MTAYSHSNSIQEESTILDLTFLLLNEFLRMQREIAFSVPALKGYGVQICESLQCTENLQLPLQLYPVQNQH